MEFLRNSRKEEQDRIFLVIKGLALFFCTYPLFELFFSYPSTDSFSELNLQSLMTSFALILVVLCVWLLLNARKSTSRWFIWLEIAVFYVICLISVLVSGGNQSGYKFLFIYMVVAYTIQVNQATGFGITALVSATLFAMDVWMYKGGGVNLNIQSDLALSILFVMVSYVLGRFAKIEGKYIEELTRLVNVDGLTGLFNHRCFFETIERTFRETKNSGESFALAMLDIDYFKQYNDIFGHQKGDTVLKQMSDCMAAQIRAGDILYRYGGEEFALILPRTSLSDAQKIAERIRLAVHDMPVEGEHLITGGCLTISVGVSEVTADDISHNDLIGRADSALYRAKYLRKNRVETYMDVLDQFSDMDDEKRDALISAKALISVVNVRDSYTYSHTERVVFNCELMAKAFGLGEEDRRTLILSASLHDLGKINISKDILIADHNLGSEEWEIIRRHPEASSNIVSKIEGFETVAQIIREHHERHDGKGYPDGLRGDSIHPLTKILTLADSFDAMTNDRPYKKAKTYANALREIRECEGQQFDPETAEKFIATIQGMLDEKEYKVS
jgi:diguanylate cyclase (GGDEF)-like protein